MELFNKSKSQKVLLGDVCEKTEYKEREPEKQGVFRFLKVEHIDAENINISRWADLREEEIPPTFYKRFEKGQVLFPTRNPHLRRAALASFEGICGEKTLTLTPKKEVIDPRLFPFLFHSNSFVNHCISFIVGSTNPHVRWRDVAKYEFLLPPIEEQQKLADLLWAGDKVLQRCRELERELGVYYETKVQNLAKGKLTKGLKEVSIGDLAQINPENISSKTSKDTDINYIDIASIGYKNIIQEEIKKFRFSEAPSRAKRIVKKGDILVALVRPYQQQIVILGEVSKNTLSSTGTAVLRHEDSNIVKLIYHQLFSQRFIHYCELIMTGTNYPAITANDLSKFKICIPTDAQIINDIVRQLDYLELQFVSITDLINNTEQINKSLINHIFG